MDKGCHRIRHKSMQRDYPFLLLLLHSQQRTPLRQLGLQNYCLWIQDECKQITFPHRVHFAYIGQAGIYRVQQCTRQ